MKTAVSIPDDIYSRAERLARAMKVSRSRLFSIALGEYVDRHAEDDVVDRINAVVDEIGDETDPFMREAARLTLERTVW
jgi:predicted transcriptional regulator